MAANSQRSKTRVLFPSSRVLRGLCHDFPHIISWPLRLCMAAGTFVPPGGGTHSTLLLALASKRLPGEPARSDQESPASHSKPTGHTLSSKRTSRERKYVKNGDLCPHRDWEIRAGTDPER